MKIDHRGTLLTNKVDIEWLRKLEPQFFERERMIKFTISLSGKRVCVGMRAHQDCSHIIGNGKINLLDLYGGNIYYDTNEVEWQSGLNVEQNIKNIKSFSGNARFITDQKTIDILYPILKQWVEI